MSQRMHPEDLRAIVAAQVVIPAHGVDFASMDITNGIQTADAILAELARTAKPEANKPEPSTTYWPIQAFDLLNRAVKAEARVAELEKENMKLMDDNNIMSMRVAESHITDKHLDEAHKALEAAEARIAELETVLGHTRSAKATCMFKIGDLNDRVKDLENDLLQKQCEVIDRNETLKELEDRVKELEAEVATAAKRERERIIKGFTATLSEGGFRAAVVHWPCGSVLESSDVLKSSEIRALLSTNGND